MKAKDFKAKVLEILSSNRGRENALSPSQLCDKVYLLTKDTACITNAREVMSKLRQENLVKRHQPGHSKSTFYYWID